MLDEIGVVWFRRDLRLDDNPAWAEATTRHGRVLALYVLDRVLLDRAGRLRRRRFLHDLAALDRSLREAGGALHVHTGDAATLLPAVAREVGGSVVYANADVTPFSTARDRRVESACVASGIDLRWSWGTLVHPPGSVRTAAGTLSQVFTPFHKVWDATRREEWPEPGAARLLDLPGEALPEPDGPYPLVGGESGEAAEPGEVGARARLGQLLARVDDYAEQRDRPDVAGSSQLSPDLRFGTLSPRTVIDVVGADTPGRAALVRQLAWRDWYAHTLLERPGMVDQPIKPAFAVVALARRPRGLRGLATRPHRCADGRRRDAPTPGARLGPQPGADGGGFVPHQEPAHRLASRRALVPAPPDRRRRVPERRATGSGWPGTGPDASPFHRVFNPVLQGRKFDPDGATCAGGCRSWPGSPATSSTRRGRSAPLELAAAGVELGVTYPERIVDLKASRERALAAYERVRG